MEKANIIQIHKRGDKQITKNYRPVSLLPIGSKIFETDIFNSLFKYLENNKVLTSNQSGFRPGYSCVHQLFSKSFEANLSLQVRGVFF